MHNSCCCPWAVGSPRNAVGLRWVARCRGEWPGWQCRLCRALSWACVCQPAVPGLLPRCGQSQAPCHPHRRPLAAGTAAAVGVRLVACCCVSDTVVVAAGGFRCRPCAVVATGDPGAGPCRRCGCVLEPRRACIEPPAPSHCGCGCGCGYLVASELRQGDVFCVCVRLMVTRPCVDLKPGTVRLQWRSNCCTSVAGSPLSTVVAFPPLSCTAPAIEGEFSTSLVGA